MTTDDLTDLELAAEAATPAALDLDDAADDIRHSMSSDALVAEARRLRATAEERGTCWHCKVSLLAAELPRCDSCPAECDGCDEPGCVEQLAKNDAVCPSNRRKAK